LLRSARNDGRVTAQDEIIISRLKERSRNRTIGRPFSEKQEMEPNMVERRKTTRNRGPKNQPRDNREGIIAEAMVATGNPGKRRARSEARRLQAYQRRKIAASLKRSAEHSSRRKAGAYRSALSMLTFYINRAGKTLPKAQRARLERAKVELKHQFGRE
jgi:hypothetical protein